MHLFLFVSLLSSLFASQRQMCAMKTSLWYKEGVCCVDAGRNKFCKVDLWTHFKQECEIWTHNQQNWNLLCTRLSLVVCECLKVDHFVREMLSVLCTQLKTVMEVSFLKWIIIHLMRMRFEPSQWIYWDTEGL